MDRLRAVVLGATGMVGQRLVKLLSHHEYFELAVVAASPSSAGKKYREAAHWYIEGSMPEKAAELRVVETTVEAVKREGGVDVAFSALPADVALKVEAEFAKEGVPVVSDASSYRMEPDVPILVAEVNPEHLGVVKLQSKRGWKSFIVTNPNCTTTVLVMALKPIIDEFGVKKVLVSTMQAVSGAGWSGVPSMAILDNVIPYIAKEEEKVQAESLKILGTFTGDSIKPAEFKVSASCHRVHVLDGHTEAVFVELKRGASAQEVAEVLRKFKGKPQELKLPTAPPQPIVVKDEPDRPQPRFDRYEGGGMAVVVGRIREDPALDNGIKFVVLGHNTIRGAAGNAVLNAELMVKEGVI